MRETDIFKKLFGEPFIINLPKETESVKAENILIKNKSHYFYFQSIRTRGKVSDKPHLLKAMKTWANWRMCMIKMLTEGI